MFFLFPDEEGCMASPAWVPYFYHESDNLIVVRWRVPESYNAIDPDTGFPARCSTPRRVVKGELLIFMEYAYGQLPEKLCSSTYMSVPVMGIAIWSPHSNTPIPTRVANFEVRGNALRVINWREEQRREQATLLNAIVEILNGYKEGTLAGGGSVEAISPSLIRRAHEGTGETAYIPQIVGCDNCEEIPLKRRPPIECGEDNPDWVLTAQCVSTPPRQPCLPVYQLTGRKIFIVPTVDGKAPEDYVPPCASPPFFQGALFYRSWSPEDEVCYESITRYWITYRVVGPYRWTVDDGLPTEGSTNGCSAWYTQTQCQEWTQGEWSNKTFHLEVTQWEQFNNDPPRAARQQGFRFEQISSWYHGTNLLTGEQNSGTGASRTGYQIRSYNENCSEFELLFAVDPQHEFKRNPDQAYGDCESGKLRYHVTVSVTASVSFMAVVTVRFKDQPLPDGPIIDVEKEIQIPVAFQLPNLELLQFNTGCLTPIEAMLVNATVQVTNLGLSWVIDRAIDSALTAAVGPAGTVLGQIVNVSTNITMTPTLNSGS